MAFPRVNREDIPDGFPDKELCTHTPHYCEENVWMLVKKVQETVPDKLQYCFPVFISNEKTHVPLWRQTASSRADGLLVWDYHVILVYCDNEKSCVFDFDTQLPCPVNFNEYCKETFRSEDTLSTLYHRSFRVISAENYLRYFSSDRRHMKDTIGRWIKPPPNYPLIQNGLENHNLPHYISMSEKGTASGKFGCVLNLSGFIERFSIQHSSQPTRDYNMYPPEPVQPSWME